MHRGLAQGQHFHGVVYDLAELSPIGEVSLIHPFLHSGQQPTGTGHVVCRPASVRVLAAGNNTRPGIAIVLSNACGQFLGLPVGEGDTLAILRPALGDQADGPDQGFCMASISSFMPVRRLP